jgi:chromosome segregation ATPase
MDEQRLGETVAAIKGVWGAIEAAMAHMQAQEEALRSLRGQLAELEKELLTRTEQRDGALAALRTTELLVRSLREEKESIRLELQAERHVRLADNAELIARAESAEAELAFAKNACRIADEAVARALKRAAEAESQSAGRLRVLNAKADELRAEWIRAENTAAELQRLREGMAALPRYNCDCLPNDPTNTRMATDDEAKGDGCVSCQRWIVLVADLKRLLVSPVEEVKP